MYACDHCLAIDHDYDNVIANGRSCIRILKRCRAYTHHMDDFFFDFVWHTFWCWMQTVCVTCMHNHIPTYVAMVYVRFNNVVRFGSRTRSYSERVHDDVPCARSHRDDDTHRTWPQVYSGRRHRAGIHRSLIVPLKSLRTCIKCK